ncbi:hypothetical protein ACFLYB_06245 [Chloroflexota bacterium]
MKRKIIAIALSLALLSSLFAFVVPVSADVDIPKWFDVSFTFDRSSRPSGQQPSFYGPPTTLTLPELSLSGDQDTRTFDYKFLVWEPWLESNSVTADLGPLGLLNEAGVENTDSVVYSSYNYSSGRGVGKRMMECDFGNGDTATFEVITRITYLWWNYDEPTSAGQYRNRTTENHGVFRMVDGTGIFEDLRIWGSAYRAPEGDWTFTGKCLSR